MLQRLLILKPCSWRSRSPAGGNRFSTTLVLAPPLSAEGPDGAGLAFGWYAVGLHSEPCRPAPHSTPDILIGPTVDEFVDAVIAHPSLDVTTPVDVELGGYTGQFLTLTAPSDITGCADWRPWEHGIPAQGPDNIWNLWVIDVDGLRVIVNGAEFPGTSEEDKAELRAIAESIRFMPEP